jgi:hypothetical protein
VTAFLKQVRAEIEKHGESMPTGATTEGIRVRVQPDGGESPLELIFRDLRGELLSEELDRIASLNRNGLMPTQVRKCDAFLFFFDPASSENPAQIDQHHQRELKRASMFIEYILKLRQNQYLPIIFVQTHLDQWDSAAQIRAKADRWRDEVHAKLTELVSARLGRTYPKSIVDKNRIFFRVSSIGKSPKADKQLQDVVNQLNELVADSRTHQHQLARPIRKLVLRSVVLGVVFLLALYTCLSFVRPFVGGLVSEWGVRKRLDEIDALVEKLPRGGNLPSHKQAQEVNRHLRWLTERLKPDSGETPGLSATTVERMQSTLNSLAQVVTEQAHSNSHAPEALTPILETYLDGFPDLESTAPDLAAAQKRYWQLRRAEVVNQIAKIIPAPGEKGPSPSNTLSKVARMLRETEKKADRSKVFGPPTRDNLLEEIQTSATFCEDRANSKSYPATFRVVSASFSSAKKVDLTWRSITLESPGQPPSTYGLEPHRQNDRDLSLLLNTRFILLCLGLVSRLPCGCLFIIAQIINGTSSNNVTLPANQVHWRRSDCHCCTEVSLRLRKH